MATDMKKNIESSKSCHQFLIWKIVKRFSSVNLEDCKIYFFTAIIDTRVQYNSQMFMKSKGICPWQAFLA